MSKSSTHILAKSAKITSLIWR